MKTTPHNNQGKGVTLVPSTVKLLHCKAFDLFHYQLRVGCGLVPALRAAFRAEADYSPWLLAVPTGFLEKHDR